MALGSYCKALGIDEEVLNGQKSKTCELKSLSNGVMWELKKYKTAKKLANKDIVDWLKNIFQINCENSESNQEQLNEKMDNMNNLRNTLSKNPSRYRGEMERFMNWPFDLPTSMGVEPTPVFEPNIRANLGPKLMKVLKEKGGDDDDSVDMSGHSDDDDEQVKKRKAREEIIQLKKDLGAAKKIITSLNDKMSDLNKRCQVLNDLSKTSVSEMRRIESDIARLKVDWSNVMTNWHDCMERLNHVNNNKGNYLDVGYMVRRNKTKQGIFDELNFEFEKTLEEFKHKVTSMIEKERRKKKVVSREYRQKSKTDRKRVRQENDDNEESKKPCLSEEATKTHSCISVDEFMKSEKVDEFKGGKFVNALKAIYMELTSTSLPCNDAHEIIFSVLDDLEPLNTEKIPSQSFAGNILMEARMAVALQSFSDLVKASKVSISNDGVTKFTLSNGDYDVTLPDGIHVKLGVRDLSKGSSDTSLSTLKELLNDLMNAKSEGSQAMDKLAKITKSLVVDQDILNKKFIDILFLYKQQICPLLAESYANLPDTYKPKSILLSNFCTGVYFLLGLAKLADVTILAWESLSFTGNAIDTSNCVETNQILSKTVQQIYTFCEKLDPNNTEDLNLEFKDFITKEKKLTSVPLAPYKGNIFNTIFHNSAGVWYYHEIGLLSEFLEKMKKEKSQVKEPEKETENKGDEKQPSETTEEKKEDNSVDVKEEDDEEIEESSLQEDKLNEKELNSLTDLLSEKHNYALARALGLIGKLVAVPLWTVLEDDDLNIGVRYNTFLKCLENWAKDSSKFMKGQDRLFEDVPVSHDAVYASLVKDNESGDSLTKELLELIFTAFVPYVKLFLRDNVTYEKMNGESAMEVDCKVPVHEDFTLFDQITMNIHSVTNFAFDALMLYSKTRNGAWQDKLSNKDNVKVFDLVERDYNKQMKILYKRKISLNKIKDLAKGHKLDPFSKCQLIEKKYKLIDDLIKWGGLWRSEKEIEAQIKDMKEYDRLSAFRAQIRFRRHILGEDCTSGLLDLASEGECFTAEKLYENLKLLMKKECEMTETDVFELASATNDTKQRAVIYESCKNAKELKPAAELSRNVPKENFHWLLGKLISHSIALDQGVENVTGICIARKKLNGVYSYFIRYKGKGVFNIPDNRIAEDFKSRTLKVIDPVVNDLVGCRLSRAFIKDDGDLEWHDCKVIGVTSGGSDFVVEFDFFGDNVQLEETTNVPEPETFTFTTHLLEDYRSDHLRLL